MIEERITRLTFDNRQFEQGIAQSLGSLEKLKASLKMDGVASGLGNVGKAAAAQAAPLNNLSEGAQTIGDRFKAMSVVATTAIATVAHQAVSRGGQIVKSLTLDPIMQGFREYEINMNSIQTIMANTGLEGKKGLKTVTGALDELNHYADQTIYNFSEMAKNIGTFTAAGVKLDVSTAAIKGIANLAAVSGSNAEQASRAMYQLSQGISAGVISLEDWNSVNEAGMGGKVFQKALIETAKVHGVNIDSMIKKEGSFRLSLQHGWLTSEIMTETLSKFTGDLTAAQLKTMGYNEKQIKGILKMGKTATDAATKVKTMTQLIDTLREGTTSGWAQTWQLIFGDFDEARTMFTGAGEVLGKFVESSSKSRNAVLKDWKELGGRTALIEGIGNAFQALMSILSPIKNAFREIFPATTGKQLYEMTVTFRDFMERLKLGEQSMNNLKRTFAGVFAVLGIGWEIVKQVGRTFVGLFQEITKGSGSFLETTANIGDFLVALHQAIKNGDSLTKFFSGLGKVLAVPIRLIKTLGSYLGSLFDDVGTDSAAKVQEAVSGVAENLEPLGRMGDFIANIWGKVVGVLDNVWEVATNIGSSITDFFGKYFSATSEFVEGMDFGDLLSGINTGVLASLALVIIQFIKGGDGFGGIIEGITDGFDSLTGALGAMQNTLRAATLLQIALAVGILALAMNTLAKIDKDGLLNASAAITIMFGQLLGSLLLFEKLSGFVGFAKMPFVAASMILLSVAVNILANAVKKLADLDWNELAKGLTGTTVLLGSLVAAAKFMPNPAGLISTGLGMIVLAGAIRLLVTSVEALAEMNWNELAKGLVGVGTLLGSLVLFTKFADASKGGIAQGAGIILLATGLKILASAVKDFSGMSWAEMGKGLAGVAGGLALVGAALYLIPPTAPQSAAGVLIVAAAMNILARALKSMGDMSWGEIGKGLAAAAGGLALITAALYLLPPTVLASAAGILIVAGALNLVALALKSMGGMSWEEIGKGLVVLAGSLAIIAGALYLMTAALPGAAALLVVSAALAILTPVLTTLGGMSWEEIGKGMVVLAGAFTILGVAGYLLTPVVPTLIGLGLAVTLLGVGMAAAGVGVLAFSMGLTALAAAGAAGTAAIVGIVGGLVGVIPVVMKQIGLGLIAFAEAIATAGPAIMKAIVTVLNSITSAIDKVMPRIVSTLMKLVMLMVNTLVKYVPRLVDAGMKLTIAVADGVSRRIDKLTDAATRLIIKFIDAVGRNLAKVIQAGVNLIIKFIDGVTKAIDSNSARIGAAAGRLGVAIIQGMVKGIAGGIGEVTAAAGRIASAALDKAKSVLGINSPSKEFQKLGKFVVQGFRKGIDGNRDQIKSAFDNLKGMLRDLYKSSDEDIDRLTARLKKLESARRKDIKAIKETRKELEQARKEKKASVAAYDTINKSLTDERSKLNLLAKGYDEVTEKLKKAQETLANAKKTRDDYYKSVRDQYSDMPSATGETTVAQYIEDLKKQVEETKVFSNAIQRLRQLGLNDEMYKDLLATGTSALPFVQELLAGGKGSVDQINSLGKQLDTAGDALGKTASKNLYDAAVFAAEGFVKGLEMQQKAIEKRMDKIADAMVKAIKKKLGIKSPSKVFEGIGVFSMEGLIGGFDKMIGGVERASEGIGDSAMNSLRKSLSNMSGVIGPDMDMKPTITPVLDLSGVRKDARGIGSLLGRNPISVDASYAKANYVANGHMKNLELDREERYGNQEPAAPLQFNQYNYSPKALSPAELYRQTNNQLSNAKGALPTSANNRRG